MKPGNEFGRCRASPICWVCEWVCESVSESPEGSIEPPQHAI
jgi:hypothetical protein